MNIRTRLCLALAHRLARPPAVRTVDFGRYQAWREEALCSEWRLFDDGHIRGKSVLDFGCGDGQLSLHFARNLAPADVTGIDLDGAAIERARAVAAAGSWPCGLSFRTGGTERAPVADGSVDTVVAFDCLEHVMAPEPIFHEWFRMLRPGGVCLLTWCPFKGPWGAHMESLIPIPWAHVVFGEQAVIGTAAALYDSPGFEARHWDLESDGRRRPNKWRQWRSFSDQGYLNQLDFHGLRTLAARAGLEIVRLQGDDYDGARWRRLAGRMLMSLPVVGEYFISKAIVELRKP